MVKLDKIYTGGGDKGETSLATGERVAKFAPRIHSQGEVDEANAAIGLARCRLGDGEEVMELDGMLARVQNDLFDLGADISVPGEGEGGDRLRIRTNQVARLEAEIDRINAGLAPLTSFVLPGGSEAAAALHVARSVVRRSERAVAALAQDEPVNGQALAYLNRLSDLLFVMARKANDDGTGDVLWRPGGTF